MPYSLSSNINLPNKKNRSFSWIEFGIVQQNKFPAEGTSFRGFESSLSNGKLFPGI